jgi:hypothetical protein
MPFVGEVNSNAIARSELKANGFWMSVKGVTPVPRGRILSD